MSGQWIYHEKQDAGLCGVHALNNLLQGPYFSEIDLMQIAQQMDSQEKNFMAELGTETEDFIKFVAEDSGNVAEDGNFSIQVLSKALTTFGLAATSITHPDMGKVRDNPQLETGFICNLKAHWFAIRKIDNTFWDFNSLKKEPSFVSDLYLGALLQQLQLESYSIFVVRGTYPRVVRDVNDKGWINSANLNRGRQQQQQQRGQLSESEQLKQALAASLQDNNNINNNNNNNFNGSGAMDEDHELMAAIRMSMMVENDKEPKNNNNKNANNNNNNNNVIAIDDDDEEMKAALALSMETAQQDNMSDTTKQQQGQQQQQQQQQQQVQHYSIPAEVEDTPSAVKLVLRLPDGNRISGKFSPETLLGQIFSWAHSKSTSPLDHTKSYALLNTFPRVEYSDTGKKLSELGISGSVALTLVIL